MDDELKKQWIERASSRYELIDWAYAQGKAEGIEQAAAEKQRADKAEALLREAEAQIHGGSLDYRVKTLKAIDAYFAEREKDGV